MGKWLLKKSDFTTGKNMKYTEGRWSFTMELIAKLLLPYEQKINFSNIESEHQSKQIQPASVIAHLLL